MILPDKRHIHLQEREEVCSALQIKANEESDGIRDIKSSIGGY